VAVLTFSSIAGVEASETPPKKTAIKPMAMDDRILI
jgi:hypothetical protein